MPHSHGSTFQPRHPKGSPKGGQWRSTSAPGDAPSKRLNLQHSNNSESEILQDVKIHRLGAHLRWSGINKTEPSIVTFRKQNGVWRADEVGLYGSSALMHKMNRTNSETYYTDIADYVEAMAVAGMLNDQIIEPSEVSLLSKDIRDGNDVVLLWLTVRMLDDLWSESPKYLPEGFVKNCDTEDDILEVQGHFADVVGLEDRVSDCYSMLANLALRAHESNTLFELIDIIGLDSWKNKPYMFAHMADEIQQCMSNNIVAEKVGRYPLGALYAVSKLFSLGKKGFGEWVESGMILPPAKIRSEPVGYEDVGMMEDRYIASKENMRLLLEWLLTSDISQREKNAAATVFSTLQNYVQRGPYGNYMLSGPRDAWREIENELMYQTAPVSLGMQQFAKICNAILMSNT